MNLNKHDENAINEFQTSNIWNHENILPLILVHVFTKPFEMKGYVPALPVALEIFSFAFQFSSTTKKQNQIIQMTYANSNHEPFNMCGFFTRPESDLCPALSVTDAADVVETLNDVTLCPKYYSISILADSAKRDVIITVRWSRNWTGLR